MGITRGTRQKFELGADTCQTCFAVTGEPCFDGDPFGRKKQPVRYRAKVHEGRAVRKASRKAS